MRLTKKKAQVHQIRLFVVFVLEDDAVYFLNIMQNWRSQILVRYKILQKVKGGERFHFTMWDFVCMTLCYGEKITKHLHFIVALSYPVKQMSRYFIKHLEDLLTKPLPGILVLQELSLRLSIFHFR